MPLSLTLFVLFAASTTEALVLDGKKVSAPQVVQTLFPKGISAIPCSGTLVGHGGDTVLFAAHCCPGGGEIRIEAEDGTERVGQCEPHPDFAKNQSPDVAVAKLDKPIEGVEPACIPKRKVTKGQGLVVLGYGEILQKDGVVADSEGKLHEGTVEVIDTTPGDPEFPHSFFVKDIDKGMPSHGDSGGPQGYRENGKLYVVGVNSAFTSSPFENKLVATEPEFAKRTGITAIERRIYPRGKGAVAAVTNLALPEVESFLKNFAKKNGVSICGLEEGKARGNRKSGLQFREGPEVHKP